MNILREIRNLLTNQMIKELSTYDKLLRKDTLM